MELKSVNCCLLLASYCTDVYFCAILGTLAVR